MPAKQAGSYYRTSGGWGVRWYEDDRRRFRSGFDSKSAARDYFGKVVRPRLDGVPAAPEPLTLREFADRYLARYEAIRAPATVRALKWRLVRPLREFGDTSLDELGWMSSWPTPQRRQKERLLLELPELRVLNDLRP